VSEILAKLEPTPLRRWFGVLMPAGLGLAMLYGAARTPPSQLVALFAMLAVSGLFLWAAVRLYRATAFSILLTRDHIASSSGEILCTIAEIASTDRGFFAMKPTNGLSVRLVSKGKRRWQPGLWWLVGKRLGIGGVTSPRQAKEMAAMLDLLVSEIQKES